MDVYQVNGIIALKDDLGIEYAVSEIEYRQWENEDFEYRFKPDYSVIDLLDSSIFQGIPGLDLSLHQKEYVRRNIVPVFISERSPAPNRQDLWELLEESHMQYLNQLEWLIQTDTKYIGDRLYVREPYTEPKTDILNLDPVIAEMKRPYDLQRTLLAAICAGYTVDYAGFRMNDDNRKDCYALLSRLYTQESERIKKKQREGIGRSKSEGKYAGRKQIPIDDTKLYEVWRKFENKKITLTEATDLLQISVSTFYRRIKKFQS